MDIDLIAEQRRCHRAAFDVPARPAAPPRTFPTYIAIFFVPGFPKREIADVFLVVLIMLNTPGRLQLGEVEMREFSVIGKFIDAKVNRPVICVIGEPFRDQRGDHVDHSVDVTLVGCGGIFVRALDAQRLRVFEKCFLELRSELSKWNASLVRAADRLVVHVGDVHHAMHSVTAQFEMPLK